MEEVKIPPLVNANVMQMKKIAKLSDIQHQKKAILAAFVIVYLPSLGLLLAVGLVAATSSVEASVFMRDATAAAGVPFYFGAVSMLGIIMWCCAAAVCLLTYYVLFKSDQQQHARGFFLWSGLLGGFLALDDAFLFHETVWPTYLGLPSRLLFAVYGIAFLSILGVYWRHFLKSDFLLLLTGGGFLAASVLVDVSVDASVRFYQADFWEDGLKFLGIAGWFSYFTGASMRQLAEATKVSAADSPLLR